MQSRPEHWCERILQCSGAVQGTGVIGQAAHIQNMRITKLKLNLPTKKKLVTNLHSCSANRGLSTACMWGGSGDVGIKVGLGEGGVEGGGRGCSAHTWNCLMWTHVSMSEYGLTRCSANAIVVATHIVA